MNSIAKLGFVFAVASVVACSSSSTPSSNTSDVIAKEPSNEPFVCSAVLDAATKDNVTFTIDKDQLTVVRQSMTGRFKPETYKIEQTRLEFREAPKSPRLACGEGEERIAIWDSFIQLGDDFFGITAAAPAPDSPDKAK